MMKTPDNKENRKTTADCRQNTQQAPEQNPITPPPSCGFRQSFDGAHDGGNDTSHERPVLQEPQHSQYVGESLRAPAYSLENNRFRPFEHHIRQTFISV